MAMTLSTLLVVLALIAAGVFSTLAFTKWGRRKPLHRYGALSVAAHLMLFAGLACVRTGGPPRSGADDAPPVSVRIVMRAPSATIQPPEEEPPLTQSTTDTATPDKPAPNEPARESTYPPEPTPIPATNQATKLQQNAATEAESNSLPPALIERDLPPVDEPPVDEPPVEPASTPPSEERSEPTVVAVPHAAQGQPFESLSLDSSSAAMPRAFDKSFEERLRELAPTMNTASTQPAAMPPASQADRVDPPADSPPEPIAQNSSVQPIPRATKTTTPSAYATRGALQQRRLSANEGGDDTSLDAVASAVDWLVRAQRPDGGWDAARWGAGRESRALGDDRGGAGGRAEMGLTGLALLAMGGAGHTHLEGPYRDTVTRGLQFLLNNQATDGNLAGKAKPFARTYCHTMATFALAEAMAVTRDDRLRTAVEAAVDDLTRAQSGPTGGWRYRPGDRGDTSQMGWAVMALRSAELAGVAIRPSVWNGCERFVGLVRCGRHGGLASYQVREGRPSSTMTAEAMYCRQILGVSRPHSAADQEAVAALLAELPDRRVPGGRRVANLYYWYYATLALHHHSSAGPEAAEAWDTWNRAMQRAVVSRQVANGPNAGSWDPDTLWGAYGGRVYTTALAAMCLEVYYRYDPETIGRDPWIAARQGVLRR